MKILHIQVVDKVATYQMRDGSIICGNDDYQLEFTFDAEWSEHQKKTARFIWNGQYFDQEFTGTTCPVPVLNNTDTVTVGVYVGESADDAILSTTRELIPCIRSIRCGNASASNGTGENYTNEARGYAEEAKKYAEALENAAVDGKPLALGEPIAKYVGAENGYFDTYGIIENEHIYLLVFNYLENTFYYFLSTVDSRNITNGHFGGYSDYNGDWSGGTPVFVRWGKVRDGYEDDNLNWYPEVYGLILVDEDGNDRTQEVAPYGDYYMDVYQLV